MKHHQTPSNIIKQGGQTVKCLITKQCLMMFGRQTFPVGPGLYSANASAFKIALIICKGILRACSDD